MEREPHTIYVASISYGKDSLAMLEAIKRLGYPLDRIISVQVWATDKIPADLPEMYEWKAHADKIIKERYGIQVERVCAVDKQTGGGLSFNGQFYHKLQKGKYAGSIKGFPEQIGSWCKKLKYEFFDLRKFVLQTTQKAWGGVFNTYGFPMRKGNWCTSELKVRPKGKYMASLYALTTRRVGASISNHRFSEIREQGEQMFGGTQNASNQACFRSCPIVQRAI